MRGILRSAMDTMRILAFSRSRRKPSISIECIWTVREHLYLPVSNRYVWHAVAQNKNTFTVYGLTELASAVSGNYVAPNYLVIDSTNATLTTAAAIGATEIIASERIDQAGDTQLILSPDTASQEIATFTGVTAVTPYIYTLDTPLQHNHVVGDYIIRKPREQDTMSSVLDELAYDPVNAPGQRIQSVAGYSPAPGQYTIQFYLTATMALGYIAGVGLSESPTIGQGNLHNHVALGHDHTNGLNDLSIDGQIILANA